MRTVFVPVLLAALTVSAAAQSNDSVTVYPYGGQVLIDPGTGQRRVVPPLLQPWQGEPVRLHAPRKHRVQPAATSTTAPEAAAEPAPMASAAPPPVAPAAPPSTPVIRKPRREPRVAATPPAPKPQTPPPQAAQQTAPAASLDSMDALINRAQTNVLSAAPAPAPPPARPAVEPPKPAAPTRTASIERSNPAASAGKRRDIITFAAGATDPSTAAVSAVHSLASSLNAALTNGAARVQLLAYAGAKGEKSSDTRRLSLKRALVIRQLLIDDGVPSERIDVFALGGVEDSGPLDRVDVYVKG